MVLRQNKQHKPEVVLGIDLGSSQIKAIVVELRMGKLALMECAERPFPTGTIKSYRDPEFVRELQQMVTGLKTVERRAFVTISCSSAMVCLAEFPPVPLAEIKSALKLNSMGYLRRDFSSYYLDTFELKKGIEGAKGKESSKTSVLVGGATRDDVDACRDALVCAKIKPEAIELAAVSVINAFQASHLGDKNDVVVLVDIGAQMTSINFLLDGMPLITRIMHFGGGQINDYIGQVLMLKPQEAEEEKRKMSAPVQELVKTAIAPLAREIRSSIDFFERQNDHRVANIYACGGTACSPQMLTILGEVVGASVKCWNPIEFLDVSQLNGDTPRAMTMGPLLAAAVGVVAPRLV